MSWNRLALDDPTHSSLGFHEYFYGWVWYNHERGMSIPSGTLRLSFYIKWLSLVVLAFTCLDWAAHLQSLYFAELPASRPPVSQLDFHSAQNSIIFSFSSRPGKGFSQWVGPSRTGFFVLRKLLYVGVTGRVAGVDVCSRSSNCALRLETGGWADWRLAGGITPPSPHLISPSTTPQSLPSSQITGPGPGEGVLESLREVQQRE